MPVAFDPPQARFDVQQRRGHPPLLLVTGPPAIDLVGPLADLGHDRLQTVGGLQAAAQGLEQSQPVQGQGLLEPLVQARDRGGVDEAELLPEPVEGRLRLGVARLLVGCLELPPPRGLLGRREVAHHILSLVPLTALHQRLRAEDRLAPSAGPSRHR